VRLARTSEFSRVKEKGRPFHGRAMLLGVLEAKPEGATRTGIVTSRRIGKAVVRNRVRRRLREIVRQARPVLRDGLWLVLVAKPPAARATYAMLREEWAQLARRGGILRETN
jgi:ribonuclease P protein component